MAEGKSARAFRDAQGENKTRATFPKGERAREWLGSGVRGLLFPLPQACVTGRQSKREGELTTRERNARVRGRLWRVAIGGIGSDERA